LELPTQNVTDPLYKIALKDLNFKATVTSPKYGEWLCKRLNIQREFYLLHDVFYKNATQYLAPEINPKSIFCGGHNGRDWKFIIDLAKQMPDVIFNIVMPGEVYRKYEESFTSNIHAKHDIARDSFYQILSESALACLPLDTEAPAGLIVMFCAAGYGKMVMTTDTVTTSEYIRDGRGECLPKDIDIWCERIRFYLNHPEQAKSCSQNLLDYFEKECSEDCFVKTLMNIIDDKAVSEK
jgi:glycosyltransferase involved in cell wall biosynthesis